MVLEPALVSQPVATKAPDTVSVPLNSTSVSLTLSRPNRCQRGPNWASVSSVINTGTLRGLPRILEMKLVPPAQISQLLMLNAKHPCQ